ncbi:hypothetical protein, partial [Paenibacillus xylanexedens]|uniref:hypothetical protein n=1 Tax=Paenibacillus xylanexedens TaxID=528191 RepID=UPI00164363F8
KGRKNEEERREMRRGNETGEEGMEEEDRGGVEGEWVEFMILRRKVELRGLGVDRMEGGRVS